MLVGDSELPHTSECGSCAEQPDSGFGDMASSQGHQGSSELRSGPNNEASDESERAEERADGGTVDRRDSSEASFDTAEKMLKLFQLPAASSEMPRLVYQEVKVHEMTSIKPHRQIMEEKQQRKVMRHADVSHILNHHVPRELKESTSRFPTKGDRGNVALMLKSELISETQLMKKAMQEGGNASETSGMQAFHYIK